MKTPDAIVVPAGGVKQNASGRWVSTDLSPEDDKIGSPGGKLRVLSAAVLAIKYPAAVVIASGGKGLDIPKGTSENRPSLAGILHNELIKCGVPEDRIFLEDRSNTTYQQLQQLEILMRNRGWSSVLLITNSYHLNRVRAMIDAKFTWLKGDVNLELVSAEDILTMHDAGRWKSFFRKEYDSIYMQERKERETAGIAQIHSGTYQFK